MENDVQKARAALAVIVPILETLQLPWVITGGFACYIYGIPRPITDIDIDVDCSKDDARFKSLLEKLAPHVSQPLEHLINGFYDNYNFEATIGGQILDICPMADLNIYSAEKGGFVPFYAGFPAHEIVAWEGFDLPLLSKELILKNKRLIHGRSVLDSTDETALEAMVADVS